MSKKIVYAHCGARVTNCYENNDVINIAKRGSRVLICVSQIKSRNPRMFIT